MKFTIEITPEDNPDAVGELLRSKFFTGGPGDVGCYTHFDWETRSCDSYVSRPGMCRDYPRALLDQPRPRLFVECGYGVRPANAGALAAALDRQPLSADQRQKLRRELDLE